MSKRHDNDAELTHILYVQLGMYCNDLDIQLQIAGELKQFLNCWNHFCLVLSPGHSHVALTMWEWPGDKVNFYQQRCDND